jgi:hypothetical protein
MLSFIQTQGGLHMVIGGQPVTVAKSDKKYSEVLKAIQENGTDSDILNILDSDRLRMEVATKVIEGVELKGGQLLYQGEPIAGVLGERMLQMLDEGFDLAPMANFLKNLLNNPSHRVVEHLYAFLEQGKNPITEDGHFLAYKAVRDDFKDIHSGKFDNSVGQVVSMSRHRVDENPNVTCSRGLHVCSFDYLPFFAQASGHVMICKVNPADVVAIPTDYNNTKMRASRYEVIAECEGYYKNEGDTLSTSSVKASSMEHPFVVEVDYNDTGYRAEFSFESLLDAAEKMEELVNGAEAGLSAVRIVNSITKAILDEAQIDQDFSDSESTVETYRLIGSVGEQSSCISAGYPTVGDAVLAALVLPDVYDFIDIVDQKNNTVKTIS